MKSQAFSDDIIRIYKDRIRILLIIYFFSEEYYDPEKTNLVRVLYTETKIQKIDFLLRNPDYFALELLNLLSLNNHDRNRIKEVVIDIFRNREPEIRRLEMEKFFFGAYEDIDDVIAFLESYGFIAFKSKRNVELNVIDKQYYITKYAEEKLGNILPKMDSLSWYVNRCDQIKRYFGSYTGTQLKKMQYEDETYRNTSYKEFIADVQEKVKTIFKIEFGEEL